jgi:tetratricopeptide (TPR) repeat protein
MTLKAWQQAALLATITFAFFFSTLAAGFVYDARLQILTGEFIHDPGNWPAVLSFRVLGMDVLDFNRPAMLASLMLDAAVWGREPFGYHLSSVLVHISNVLLVWMLTRELIGREKLFSSMLAALVFAVHPIVTEAVCEPSYREDLLVALFSLSAVVLAIRHSPSASGLDPWRAIGCALLSLLAIASKEAGIIAPMLLAAFWLLFRRTDPGRFWAVAIGGGSLLVVAFLAARFLFEPYPSTIFATKPQYVGGSLAQAMLVEPRILALYAQLILFPANLCADYGIFSIRSLPLPLAILLLTTIAAAGAMAARHDRRLLFAYALILLPLVPVANLIPIYQPAADRYLYLPMAGIALAMACLLDSPWLVARKQLGQRVIVGCMVAVALLGMASMERQKVWANPVALWDDCYRKNPDSLRNVAALGEALRQADRLPEAEQLTREAIRLSSGKWGDTWAVLALILDAQGREAEAVQAIATAIEIDPRLADPEARVRSLAMERPMAEDLKRLLARIKADWPREPKTGY